MLRNGVAESVGIRRKKPRWSGLFFSGNTYAKGTLASIGRSWILVPGYWMFLDFIIGAFLNNQHPVSSIRHLPTNRNRLNHTGNGR